MRSGCVLDLALRLLNLWTSADMHDLAASWINDLAKLASSTVATSRSQSAEGKKALAVPVNLAYIQLNTCMLNFHLFS